MRSLRLSVCRVCLSRLLCLLVGHVVFGCVGCVCGDRCVDRVALVGRVTTFININAKKSESIFMELLKKYFHEKISEKRKIISWYIGYGFLLILGLLHFCYWLFTYV